MSWVRAPRLDAADLLTLLGSTSTFDAVLKHLGLHKVAKSFTGCALKTFKCLTQSVKKKKNNNKVLVVYLCNELSQTLSIQLWGDLT